MQYLWMILLIAFIILEASTAQFICIWFAGGALAALVCALVTESLWLQATVFLIVTVILLFSTKKIVHKLKNTPAEKTNVDAVLGKTGIVTEQISNNASKGTVKINGMYWSARSQNGEVISEGSLVTAIQIDGVKLIVKNKEED